MAPAIAVDIENRMAEFESTVKRIHDGGLKVIIDFVCRTIRQKVYHSELGSRGIKDFRSRRRHHQVLFALQQLSSHHQPAIRPSFGLVTEEVSLIWVSAKATGNDCYSAFCGRNDWYETVKLNYGYDPGDRSCHFSPIPDTWLKMLHIMRFWASKVSTVSGVTWCSWCLRNSWHWAIPQVKNDYPELDLHRRIYDVNLYRTFLDYCGFDYLYDKVNLYDTLVGIERHNMSARNDRMLAAHRRNRRLDAELP